MYKKFKDERLPRVLKAAFNLGAEVAKHWDDDQEVGLTTGAAAVLFLFLWDVDDGRLYVVLTQRTTKLSTHKGQISFAGGHRDRADKTPEQTALREAFEEIGLDRDRTSILGRLNRKTSVDGISVIPILGFLEGRKGDLRPNASEIAEIIFMPVESTLACMASAFDFNIFGIVKRSALFRWRHHKVWGLTAEIILSAGLSYPSAGYT